MRVEIRRIRADEGPTLMQVRLLSLLDAPYAFAGTYADTIQNPAELWTERAAAASVGGSTAIFLAFAGSDVVGVAGAFQPDGEPLARRIYGVWVEPALRGQGLGGRLVETVLAWSDAAGAEHTELWVNESNIPAMRLYDSLGFRDGGRQQPMRSNETVTERLLVRPAGRAPSA